MTVSSTSTSEQIVDWTAWRSVSTKIIVDKSRKACCSTRDFVEPVRRELFSTTLEGDIDGKRGNEWPDDAILPEKFVDKQPVKLNARHHSTKTVVETKRITEYSTTILVE